MPNWCYSSYSFSFDDPLKAEKYGGILKKAGEAGERGQDFGTGWLGNVLLACEWPKKYEKSGSTERIVIGDEKCPAPGYRYRGDITYYERCDSEIVVDTETAWGPMPGTLATALLFAGMRFNPYKGGFDDMEVSWSSEEGGCEFYAGSDSEYCEGDIHVQLECDEDKYETDKRFSSIFCYENSWQDTGARVQEFTTFRETLLKDINSFVYGEDEKSYKSTLDEAIKALKESHPDYSIEVYVSDYSFGYWLSDDEISDIEKQQDMLLEKEWDEFSGILFDEDEEGNLILSEDWNRFRKGSSRDEIWAYFDGYHSKGVRYLLYEREAV